MAGGAGALTRHWPGLFSALLVAALCLGPLVAVGLAAEGWSGLGPADHAAIRFTLTQAVLSAVLSVGLAVPVARALARRRFAGRSVLVTLLGAPFILPVIVAVLGLLAVFGRNGLVSVVLGWFGLPPVHIYGLHGVLLAHVFFNLPLATRLILQGWLDIPAERFRLAASLGFGPWQVFRLLEVPMLGRVVPGALAVVFLICSTSFAVVLALGGGPAATTVELAIYQAFRFDFDLGKAALLSLVQFGICLVAAGLALSVRVPETPGGGQDRTVERFDARGAGAVWADRMWISLAALFLLVPLAAVVWRGLGAVGGLAPSVFAAAGRSIAVSLSAAALTVVAGLALSIAVVGLRGRPWVSGMLEGTGFLAVAISPLVLGTGLFIVLFPLVDPVGLALPITAVVNAVASLPFALRILVPSLREIEARFGPLADSLGMRGRVRMRLLLLPRLRRQIGFSAGLAAALAMGDLGVIALFADPGSATLPLQMYRLMAAYRMADAAGAALLLLALSLALFWLFDRGGRINADT